MAYFTKGKILIGTADPEVTEGIISKKMIWLFLDNREEDQYKGNQN